MTDATDTIDIPAARDLLEDIGFLLVAGPPFVRGPAYLLVAVRPSPTLEHFDPERTDYWVTSGEHGTPASIGWATREPEMAEHSWGTIRVVDRLEAANEFVSFGGPLLVSRLSGVKVVVFRSDAPIVARGGHSQPWEAGAMEMAGFLARLRGAADPRGSLERRLARLSPSTRYAAFVADGLARIRAREASLGWTRADRSTLGRERRRLESEAPADWAAGSELAQLL